MPGFLGLGGGPTSTPRFGGAGGGPGLGGYRQQYGGAVDQSQTRQEQDRRVQDEQRLREWQSRGLGLNARQSQYALAQRLANPEGPSLAELQMQEGLRQGASMGMNQALGMARGSRGNPMLAMRNAQMAQGQMAGQLAATQASQGAMLRAQEEQMRRQELAQLLSGMRGQDMGLMGLDQSGQGLALQSQGLGQQREMGYAGLNQQMEQSQMDAEMQQRNLNMQQRAQNMQLAGSALSGASGLLAMSDERLKRDIRDGDEDATAFLRALAPKAFRYQDEKPGSSRLGIMAQDVERARPELVKETSIGKAIDVPQATGALLAAAAHLHRRLERVEGKAR